MMQTELPGGINENGKKELLAPTQNPVILPLNDV